MTGACPARPHERWDLAVIDRGEGAEKCRGPCLEPARFARLTRRPQRQRGPKARTPLSLSRKPLTWHSATDIDPTDRYHRCANRQEWCEPNDHPEPTRFARPTGRPQRQRGTKARTRLSIRKDGAQEKTRTSTPIRELAPEASASTNSATWACRGSAGDTALRRGCQRLDAARGRRRAEGAGRHAPERLRRMDRCGEFWSIRCRRPMFYASPVVCDLERSPS